MKICTKCNVDKDISYFWKDKSKKDGLRPRCKTCEKDACGKWIRENPEKAKLANKEWTERNSDRVRELQHNWYIKNRELTLGRAKKHQEGRSPEKIEERKLKYAPVISQRNKDRRKTDLKFKISRILRCRIANAVKGRQKYGSSISDLGCSIEYFKNYLEFHFTDGMSWNNYGYGMDRWNIDHIKPLSKFDLTDRKQFLEACHYTNMQPMWQIDNQRKSAKYEKSYSQH